MALIKCFNCGQPVSDKADVCPKCGANLHMANNNMGSTNQPQPQGGYQQPIQGGYQQPQSGFQQPMQGGYQQQNTRQIKSEYSMSFGGAISNCFNKFNCFTGRARRKEFWYFYLFNILIYGVVYLLAAIIIAANSENTETAGSIMMGVQVILILWGVVVLLPGLGVFCRRMHDIGKSGAWFFISLIPFVGAIVLLIFQCRAGDIGPNEYGDDPKYEVM